MNKKEEFREGLKYTPENTKEQQQYLTNTLNNAIDTYQTANSLESKTFMCYLISAIYISCKEMYPDLKVSIPFRIKSDASTTKNIQNEFNSGILKFDSSKSDNLPDLFNLEKATDDMTAATMVLEHIKSSLKPKSPYVSEEIKKLRKIRNANEVFINNTELLLEDGFIGEEQYLKLYMNTLERLIDSTYDEFTAERPIPYKTELDGLEKIYAVKSKVDNFSSTVDEKDIEKLQDLIMDLRSRLNDKLQYEILREIFPKICESPLIKNSLLTTAEFVKDVKKENGFGAIYYRLNTPFGKIEFQLQSNKRYFEAKQGSAFHSGMKGKEIDIASYFELVDKNDEHDLNFYLDVLDTVPANSLISDTELPNFQSDEEKDQFLKTPLGKKYLQSQKIREYMKHIKLKDTYTYVPDSSITYADDTGIHKKDSGIYQAPTEMSFDEYLLLLAKSHSPYMSVCDSAHTSFSEMASLRPKDLVDEFSEVLRKRDSLTCLRHVLVERLDHILKTNPDSEYEENRRITESLPKEISRIDIVKYSEHLKDYLAAQNANKGTNEKEL